MNDQDQSLSDTELDAVCGGNNTIDNLRLLGAALVEVGKVVVRAVKKAGELLNP